MLFFFLNRGTALSHQLPLSSAPQSNPSISEHADEPLALRANDTDNEHSIHTQHSQEHGSDTRRPRVSFSDFNKVQFFEDHNEPIPQQPRRRQHRSRTSKKSAVPINNNNPVSPPSIQHSQTLYLPYRPLSRQQPVAHELHIRKQQLIPSPRAQSSRITHLPDILNQSFPTDNPPQEKYHLQREKSFLQFPEPASELPINSSAEISRESTRAGGVRPTLDYSDPINPLLNSSSFSSSLTSRQRPTLRTISLRHQFTSPLKTKSINLSSTQTNRRSASLKHPNNRNSSVDDDQDEIVNHHLLSTFDHRPVTGTNYSKHVKRNYIIHFNSKGPFNGNSTHEAGKTNLQEISQERFQNVLKISRPPYIQNSHPDSVLQNAPPLNGSIRSSRTTSGRGSNDYQLPSNTIFV